MSKNGIVVYCASSHEVPEIYLNSAREMGRLLAEGGFSLVCGGGARGLMAEAIEGCVDAGGEAVGVLPGFMVKQGWAHPRLSRMIETETMHVRKMTMAEMSVGAVALAGGIGTLDELCEIMTWNQLGLYPHPVVIVNTDGFYDPLLAMFERMKAQEFMRGGRIPAVVVKTPEEAVNAIKEWQAKG